MPSAQSNGGGSGSRGTEIRSVAKASQILIFLAEEGTGRTATQLAVALGIPTPTTHHLLNTLVQAGLLAKDDARQYWLGPRVGLLVDSYMRRMAPPEHLIGSLHALAEETGETSYVSAWRDGEIVVLSTVEGTQAVRVAGLHRGFRGFAHARASGKLLLAYEEADTRQAYLRRHPPVAITPHTIAEVEKLEQEFGAIRDRGYAEDDEEYREGVSCLAAPVMSGSAVIAAFAVAVPTERLARVHDDVVAALLRATRRADSGLVPTSTI